VLLTLSPFTAWFNATGQPAMFVPTYRTAHRIPPIRSA
jgi:hypothetical protein